MDDRLPGNLNLNSQPQKKVSRRILLGGLAASAASVFLKQASGQIIQAGIPQDSLLLKDPTKVLGLLPGTLGDRSTFEKPVRKPSDTSSRTPLQDLYGTITPSDLHYERHPAGIPAIDPRKYELLIHGMVERPTVFTLSDLKRFPSLSRMFFLECSGNYRGGKETLTPQDICGLTSQSEWTGVMLSTLFREVGIHSKSNLVSRRRLGRCYNDSKHTRKQRTGRWHDRLCAKWRGLASCTRLSRATGITRMGRKHLCKMDSSHRSFGPTVYD